MTFAPEQWRPVVGFEDYYEVSDQGRVRSLARTCRNGNGQRIVKPRILKPAHDGASRGGIGRHTKICMSIDGVTTQRQVHILVLEAFVGLRPQGTETRHLNGVPDNNRLLNLRWGTPLENVADARRHSTLPQGSSKANAKLREMDIPIIRAAYAAGVSMPALARKYGVHRGTIQQIFNGRAWTHVP